MIERILMRRCLRFYSVLFPVYWKQDIQMKNSGQDILSVRTKEGSYFYGTLRERNKFVQNTRKII